MCTVGDYLLRRLREVGVRHVFGVPGDCQMEFLDQVEAVDGLEWVGNCNELNAACAADGYGRLNGIAALVITFGVGELSALKDVAGAHAESVPTSPTSWWNSGAGALQGAAAGAHPRHHPGRQRRLHGRALHPRCRRELQQYRHLAV
ncbi:thiamine pyrophosphate-binding protein [Streptomyces sp. 6N106]|uniref:thiamine pyrophosphate-binding protein n=1 Tax=Streptomyces sp. 6N106 TaxID=3457418 RepID=UPI003FD40FC0